MENDIIKKILSMAMEAIYSNALSSGEYEVLVAKDEPDSCPNFILKKNEELYFVYVLLSSEEEYPELSESEKEMYLNHSQKFGAKTLVAPVCFMKAPEGGIFTAFKGFEEITF